MSAFKVCIFFAFVNSESSALLHQKYSFFLFPLMTVMMMIQVVITMVTMIIVTITMMKVTMCNVQGSRCSFKGEKVICQKAPLIHF